MEKMYVYCKYKYANKQIHDLTLNNYSSKL